MIQSQLLKLMSSTSIYFSDNLPVKLYDSYKCQNWLLLPISKCILQFNAIDFQDEKIILI